jgi:ADP-ribosylglycohydrolase
MSIIKFEDRVKGCLIGSVIGAELGFSGHVKIVDNKVENKPESLLNLDLSPDNDYIQEPTCIQIGKILPFIDLGINAFLNKKGRVTPEDFAELLKNDKGIASPIFVWDNVHTVQEILKEGMNPRISGLYNAPHGLFTVSMMGTGIYHFSDPEYAYLDAVELASVAQPRTGADWAGLCASAISAALDVNSNPGTIIDIVLKLAHRNNKELYYQTNNILRESDSNVISGSGKHEKFINWWYAGGGKPGLKKELNWIGYNPIGFVLPVLKYYSGDIKKVINLLISPLDYGISASIGAAVCGCLYGQDIFPKEWVKWAKPVAEKWFPIIDIVGKRIEREKIIVSTVKQLTDKKVGERTQLSDKIYGCLLASSIGNAMGSPFESQMYFDIDKKYPNGVTTIVEPERLETEDDNQMAMLLVETYLDRHGLPVMARHFGKTWKDKLNRDHFFIQCMGNAYDNICKDIDPRITGHWSQVTGSTVMCMEPVGIYHMIDPENAYIDATAISYMYQRGLDVVTAAILSAAVAEAFNPEATVDSILKVVLKVMPKDGFKTFDKRQFKSPYDYMCVCLEVADKYTDVLSARKELYEKCLLYHAIDPLELLGLAFAMFKIAKGDVRQSAIGGTSIGRDSDTIAGRAAMLSGILKGSKSVPVEWINMFKNESLERIKSNADKLSKLISVEKTNILERRYNNFVFSTMK